MSIYPHLHSISPTLTSSSLSFTSCSSSQGLSSVILGTPLLEPNNDTLALDPGQRISSSGNYHVLTKLICPFRFLKCTFSTTRESSWRSHSLAHFQNRRLPRTAFCSLCRKTFGISTNARDADREPVWAQKMHSLYNHLRTGLSFGHAAPEFELFRQLWQKELIDVSGYQELVQNQYLSHAPRSAAISEGLARPDPVRPHRAP